MDIDLSRRETEAGWQKILDDFWLSATPKWFEWMGWALLLGALQYLADRTGERLPRVVLAVSWAFVFLYFQSFFFRVQLTGLRWPRSKHGTRMISLTVSAAVAMVMYLSLTRLVAALVSHGAR